MLQPMTQQSLDGGQPSAEPPYPTHAPGGSGALPGADDAALSYRGELYRKGLHLLALVIPAGMYLLGRPLALSLLIPLAVTAVAADVLRARSARFSQFIRQNFGRMMRTSEWPPAGRIVLNGATWVLVSATLLTVLFPVDLAAPAFAAFMVADAAAALVGLRFGKRRWRGTRRTVEGSLAFTVTAFTCLVPFDHILVLPAATAALSGAAAEVPEWAVNDNVRVPLIMAGILLVFWL